MTDRHDSTEPDALAPGLLDAWATNAEPPPGFAERVAQQWIAERDASAREMVSERSAPTEDRPHIPEPVAAPSGWMSTLVVAAVATIVAVLGLSSLDFEAATSDHSQPLAVSDSAIQPADEQQQALEAELAQVKRDLKRVQSEKAALEKRAAKARSEAAQGFVAKGSARLERMKPVTLGDIGQLLPRVGSRVSVSKTKGRRGIVVEQNIGVVDFELSRVATVEVVTPAGKLTVKGKSFTVNVPRNAGGDVTVSPRAGQAVVATASGKATLGHGESVAVARKRSRRAGAKAHSKGRAKRAKLQKMMTF